MLTSLALVFLVGLGFAAICQKIRLPRIIGMLITGILLGPYVFDLLDDSILSISADLRQMALVIILMVPCRWLWGYPAEISCSRWRYCRF